MKICDLNLVNIGPFRNANLSFIDDGEEQSHPSVIFITGENGAGKSIILDAIRAGLLGRHEAVERDITSSDEFLISLNFLLDKEYINIESKERGRIEKTFKTNNEMFNKIFQPNTKINYQRDFVIEYWTSKLSNDDFKINNISAIKAKNYLKGVLSGVHKNVDLTKIITFFDYLKDSKSDFERQVGGYLFNVLKDIINMSISDGEFSHVSRIDLKPIVKIGNSEVSLDKLSSGNLYLIQRLASVLSQLYSICVLNDISIENYKEISGIILIDEAENHLHPKWQKTFLPNVLKLFPNLQLIVSTHSPFIIASITNSKVYVCKSKGDYSVVEEETDYYTNKPIEEILMSPLFNTNNFSSQISKLIDDRKIASKENRKDEVKEIEKKLLELNPEYFDYFNIESVLNSIKK